MITEEESDQLLVNLLKSQRNDIAKINSEALDKLHETHIKFLNSLGDKSNNLDELDNNHVISVPEDEGDKNV